MSDISKEIKEFAQNISKILIEKGNPYIEVVITQNQVLIKHIDEGMPIPLDD